jgi:F-type H+-transporting ATPase subunit b
MKRRIYCVAVLLALFGCLTLTVAAGQEKPAEPAKPQAQQSAQQPANPNRAASNELVEASKEAEHAEEGEHEHNAEFKYSAMVARLGKTIGLDAHGMYWVSLAINFIILALFFWMLLKAKIPQFFRDRTSAIQKAMKEAQAASADATARLNAIEARLAKMDAEVAEIKSGAEREAVAEEERIRTAAEDDKQKVVAAAEAEIAAIARSARHDLKNFAASLAVDIAAHKIKVDDSTDQALVRNFAGHLGKDGQ